METKIKPSELVKQVASPGGTTERGLQELNNSDIQKILKNVIDQSMERAKELGKQAK